MITENNFIKANILNSPLLFTRYFFKHQYNRKFIVNHHHETICKYIKKIFSGEITRLIVNMPPRYGKTELLVKTLMSMGLALNPKSKYIHTSYSDTLALDNSESVKNLVNSDEYQKLFPLHTRKDSKSKKKWYTEEGGGVYATSSGGQITGFGAGHVDNEEEEINNFINDIEIMQGFGGAIIIDDPIKPIDATSMTIREGINERFDNTIRSRTNSRKTPIIIVMQRVHENDLTGYLMEKPDEWDVLSLPALGENNTPLWEMKHNFEELVMLRKINARVYFYQYQQETKKIKTGGEFWKSFDLNKHVQPLNTISDVTYHVSIDDNVTPYITLSIWQLIKHKDGYNINQVHEIPCKDPYNTATKAAKKYSNWLVLKNNKQATYIYGDPTTKNRNTIDDDKKSFLDKFCDEIKKNHAIQKRMFSKAPSVAMSGEFINTIYESEFEGLKISINETCTYSISDYIETKQDADGSMLKPKVTDPITKVRYEPYGHFSDAKRYFICKAFETQYLKWQNRFSQYSDIVVGKAGKMF